MAGGNSLAFNRKVFVVDKYTERFFSRLGLIEPGMNNAYSMGVEIQRNMAPIII